MAAGAAAVPGKKASTVTEGIDQQSQSRKEMDAALTLVSDIWGGTKTMRAANKRHLPKEPKETESSYQNRLQRSTFFNGYKRSIVSLVGKPFSKPVQVLVTGEGKDEATPVKGVGPKVAALINNVDRHGRGLDVFARDVLTKGMADGMRILFVDYSNVEAQNLAEERAQSPRPYVIEIDPKNLIAANADYVDGEAVLKHIRWWECITETVGFVETEVKQIRVLEVGLWAIYRVKQNEETKKEEWYVYKEGTMTLDRIPVVCFYAGRTGFFQSEPLLLDLAYLNIQHWQSTSDQANILHFARVPILFGRGMPETNSSGEKITYEISGNAMITTSDDKGDMKFVEHTGKAIEAGQTDIEAIESRMAIMGAELLVRKQPSVMGPKTATQTVTDLEAEYSELAGVVIELEDALEQVLYLFGAWLNEPVPQDVKLITIHKDFGIALRDMQDMSNLLTMRKQGDLTRRQLLLEFQRRGALDPAMNIDDELTSLDEEQVAQMKQMALAANAGAGSGNFGGGGAAA